MAGIRTFLDSSSIHGLGHISTTRSYSRLFWICVVVTGFSVAGFLINQSVESWSEQPFVTTIETMPTEELKLPKITVCPPKNRFTDLNYDLVMAKNMSFTKEMKTELSNYAKYVIDKGFLKYLSKVEEKDHFYNYYHGLSGFTFPNLNLNQMWLDDDIHPTLSIQSDSYALSGTISTEHFGEKFNIDLMERNVDYTVRIKIPNDLINWNSTIKINMKVEWVLPEKGSLYLSGYGAFTGFSGTYDFREYNLSTTTSNPILISYDYKHQTFGNDLKMDFMPGFKITWSYSGIELSKRVTNNSTPRYWTTSFGRNIKQFSILRAYILLIYFQVYKYDSCNIH